MYLENLKRHWTSQLAHFLVGLLAGRLLTSRRWAAAGAVLMGMVAVRQGLEFAKRKDTPGIDLSYHISGLVTGIGIWTGAARESARLINDIRSRYADRNKRMAGQGEASCDHCGRGRPCWCGAWTTDPCETVGAKD